MPPQMALISILHSATNPVSGDAESCIILTEPLFTCVVKLAHNAEVSAPKRISLPSINAVLAAKEDCSVQKLSAVELNDINNMLPKIIHINAGR